MSLIERTAVELLELRAKGEATSEVITDAFLHPHDQLQPRRDQHPCGFTKSGLPIGLQIQAGPFEEKKLMRVVRMLEKVTDWHTKRPKMG